VLDYRLEDALVRGIIDAISEREVDRVVLSLADTNIAELTSPGEVLSVFVERHRHNSVCGIEGLLDPISMMNINVDV
jgi:hypothetical protein